MHLVGRLRVYVKKKKHVCSFLRYYEIELIMRVFYSYNISLYNSPMRLRIVWQVALRKLLFYIEINCRLLSNIDEAWPFSMRKHPIWIISLSERMHQTRLNPRHIAKTELTTLILNASCICHLYNVIKKWFFSNKHDTYRHFLYKSNKTFEHAIDIRDIFDSSTCHLPKITRSSVRVAIFDSDDKSIGPKSRMTRKVSDDDGGPTFDQDGMCACFVNVWASYLLTIFGS